MMDVPTDVVPIGLPFRIVPDPEASLRESLHHLSALVALRAWRADGVSLTATCLRRRGDAGLEHKGPFWKRRSTKSKLLRASRQISRHPEKRHTTPARWLPRPLPAHQKLHPVPGHITPSSSPSPSLRLCPLRPFPPQPPKNEDCLWGCNNATVD